MTGSDVIGILTVVLMLDTLLATIIFGIITIFRKK